VPAGNLANPAELASSVRALRPHVIVNAAAWTAVDLAESRPDDARVLNALAPAALADAAKATGALLVHYGTDYVFDGSGERPWTEDDATGPLNVYGQTKLEGEQAIRESGCRHLVLRTSWVYASRGKNFLCTILRLAAERDTLKVVDDQFGAPTSAELIADVTAHAVLHVTHERAPEGLYHLVAAGTGTWHDFATHAIERARGLGWPVRVASNAIAGCRTSDFPTPAPRPRNSRLATDRLRTAFGVELPDWHSGVTRAVTELAGQ
jgi:dTDP-4-dehydrorhamnose reductase